MPGIPVGLIGFGSATRVFHAPVIRAVAGLELSAILQRRGDSAGVAYPDVQVFRDLDGMLASSPTRLMVIATPNASHYELARRCLLAGRDVVVDKPFTPTSVEARALAQLASSTGRLLSVFQNRRWDGDFLTVRRLIEAGTLGRVVLFESHFDRFRPARRTASWREGEGAGSGLLFDIGPHLLDQALVLFGTPEAVTADVRVERGNAVVDDAFDILLHYSGFRVLLRATMLACSPGPRFMVQGDRGTFRKHGLDPQENALKEGARPGSPGWGEEDESQWGTLSLAGEDGSVTCRSIRTDPGDYRGFYANVRDAILGTSSLAVPASDGLRVIRLLELARESSLLRRTVECVGQLHWEE
jgi:scyllo-inositol 2-dehydrogenase (NADP+)